MNNRFFIWLIIFLVIIGGTHALRQIPFDGSPSTIKLVSESNLIEIDTFHEHFQSQKAGSILIIEAKNGFKKQKDFLRLDSITSKLAGDSLITNVSSITNLSLPNKNGLNIEYQKLIPYHSNDKFKRYFSKFEEYPDIIPKFISSDFKYALIFLEHDKPLLSEHIETIKKWAEFNENYIPRFVESDLSEHIESEFYSESYFLGIVSILLVLITFLLFTRRLRGILLIFSILLFNLSATLLFMWIFNFTFTIHMVVLPCLIVIFTFSDLLHILYHQTLLKNQVETDEQLRTEILKRLKSPILITSISNLFGFILFFFIAFNPILKDLSIIAIFAIVTAFISARFITIPLLKTNHNYIDIRVINKIQNWRIFNNSKTSRPSSTFALLIVSILAFFVLILNDFEVSDQKLSSADKGYNESQQIIEEAFFGSQSLEIAIDYKDSSQIWDLNTLKTIETLENIITCEFEPLYINSPVIVAKRFHRFKINGYTSAYLLPNNAEIVGKNDLNQYGENFGASEVIGIDKMVGKIQFGFKNLALSDRLKKINCLEIELKKISNNNLSFKLIGMDYLSDKYTYSFTTNLLIAWLIATLLIGITMMLVLKSVLKGIVIIAVNVLPLLMAIYFMPQFGLAINPQSLFLLTILSGLCVDDSIYIMMSKVTERKQLEFYPILTTSVVLTAGFLSFGFSNFTWLSPFLWVFLIGMISALILDIFILPTFKINPSE